MRLTVSVTATTKAGVPRGSLCVPAARNLGRSGGSEIAVLQGRSNIWKDRIRRPEPPEPISNPILEYARALKSVFSAENIVVQVRDPAPT